MTVCGEVGQSARRKPPTPVATDLPLACSMTTSTSPNPKAFGSWPVHVTVTGTLTRSLFCRLIGDPIETVMPVRPPPPPPPAAEAVIGMAAASAKPANANRRKTFLSIDWRSLWSNPAKVGWSGGQELTSETTSQPALAVEVVREPGALHGGTLSAIAYQGQSQPLS